MIDVHVFLCVYYWFSSQIVEKPLSEELVLEITRFLNTHQVPGTLQFAIISSDYIIYYMLF